MSDTSKQQSRLKELIARGKEQGYLTFTEVNDHLPEDISDPDQVEDIIRMINDMGISVSEQAPDADELITADSSSSTDEAAIEEAAAALASVESDAGRTTDPVRMYMREMGTVELLTREGEILLAKRIEEGLRDVMSALAHFPSGVPQILASYEASQQEEGRLTDVLNGFIDPDDDIPVAPAAPAASSNSDDDDEEEGDRGPDPEEVRQRFENIEAQYLKAAGIIQEKGRDDKEAVKALAELATLFAPIKLVPRLFDKLVSDIRNSVDHLRAQERSIMRICTQRGRMSRKEFIKEFPGNELNNEWVEKLCSKDSPYGVRLLSSKVELLRAQRKLIELEKSTGLTLSEIKEINRRKSIGEARARRAKKEMVEANLRL
ncbi:MAG: RNA polymerase sigma factor RpoD, partial [Motiliproteus sp.]|nr:RNA polymerase sigma factor RpoD [Motiliproteus sp.]